MAANKLQEAITLIRAGDKQRGQKLLTEVIETEPANETAWLWMAALMSGEKRRFCLEKVLSINPNHVQAREQLAKLASAAPLEPTIPTTVSTRVLPHHIPTPPVEVQPAPEPQPKAPPAPSYEPVQGTPLPQVWLKAGKYLSSILYLEGNNLLAFDAPPDKAAEVLEEVRLGVTPQQFDQIKNDFHLLNVSHIQLSRVVSVTLFVDGLKIVGTDKAGKEKRISVTINKENSEAVLKALQERLGPDFQRSVNPISRSRVIMSAAALFAITCCGTGGLYWFVQGLKAEVDAEGMSGSARARGIANLLLLIGPNGFLCIGGVIMVIGVIAMISALRKPPEETVIARGSISGKES